MRRFLPPLLLLTLYTFALPLPCYSQWIPLAEDTFTAGPTLDWDLVPSLTVVNPELRFENDTMVLSSGGPTSGDLGLAARLNYALPDNYRITYQFQVNGACGTVSTKILQTGDPWSASSTCYNIGYEPCSSLFWIEKFHNGDHQILASRTMETTPGTWYAFSLTKIGTRFVVRIDGFPYFSVQDYPTGLSGGTLHLIAANDGETVTYDDVHVEGIELDAEWILSPVNGHLYARTALSLIWQEQEAFANLLGAHLATIRTPEENAWIRNTFVGTLWIGFSDYEQEGNWIWSSGEPVTYTNWSAGEPNNADSGEDFAEMGSAGSWNDTRHYINRLAVIEASSDVQFSNVSIPQLPSSRSASWVDCDADGDDDLYVVRSQSPNVLLVNEGDAQFVENTPAVLDQNTEGSAAAWFDFQGDGTQDLYLSNYLTPNLQIWRFPTNENYVAWTSPSLAITGPSRGVSIADYDRDGALDIFLASSSASPNCLAHNNGLGSFLDASQGSILDNKSSLMGIWGDYDNDGDPDLYVVNWNYPNQLLRNDSGTFTDAATGAIANVGNGDGAAWGDYDGDGRLDLYVTCNGTPNLLLHNDGNGL